MGYFCIKCVTTLARGSEKELGRTVVMAKRGRISKGYQKITANEFIKNPELYSEEGEWLDIEVQLR